jgi:hypothetical protein
MARLFCCGSLRQRSRNDPSASQRARRSASQAPEAQAPKPDGSPKTEAYVLPLNELARNGSHSSNSQPIGENGYPNRPGTNQDYITTTKFLEPQLVENKSVQEQPYRFLWEIAVAELSDTGSKHVRITFYFHQSFVSPYKADITAFTFNRYTRSSSFFFR